MQEPSGYAYKGKGDTAAKNLGQAPSAVGIQPAPEEAHHSRLCCIIKAQEIAFLRLQV